VGIDCLTFDFQFTGIAFGAGATAPISLFDPLAEVTFMRVTRSFEDEQHDYVRCVAVDGHLVRGSPILPRELRCPTASWQLAHGDALDSDPPGRLLSIRDIPAIAPRRAQIQDVSTKVPAARICCYR
jgi:hypothetical protein